MVVPVWGRSVPGKIFVNYRRDDERAVAARVRDRLAATFGDANVFMDVDHLLAGQRFDQELEKALAEPQSIHKKRCDGIDGRRPTLLQMR